MDTVKTDENIEKERKMATIDSTVALIHNLQKNGDITKQIEDKCVTTFRRKVREQDKELDTQFAQDTQDMFKSFSAKNKVCQRKLFLS